MSGRWWRRVLSFLAVIVRILTATVFGVYVLASRTALYVVTLWLLVYFTANAPPFAARLWDVVDEAIPGRIEARTVQWGPLPWRVRVLGARVMHPDGGVVIEASRLYAEVDLVALATWLARAVTAAGDAAFRLHVRRTVVDDFDVVLDFPSPLGVRLAEAFATPEPSVRGEPPSRVRVDIDEVYLRRGRCRLRFEAGDFDTTGIEVDGGTVRVRGPRVTVDVASARIARATARRWAWLVPTGRPVMTARGIGVASFRYDLDAVAARSISATIDGVAVRGGGALRFPDEGPLDWDAWASADLDAASPLVAALTQGAVQGPATVQVQARGPLDRLHVAGHLAMPRARVFGLDIADLEASGALGRTARGFVVERAAVALRAAGGTLRARSEGLVLGGAEPLAARVDASGIDLAQVLSAFAPRAPAWLRGTVNASGVGVALSTAPLRLEVSLPADGLRWRVPAGAIAPRSAELGATGRLTVAMATGGVELGLASVRVNWPGTRVDVPSAHLDLATGRLDARVGADVRSLRKALRPWRIRGLRGRLRVDAAHVEGRLDALRVHPVRVSLAHARVGGVELGRAALRLSMRRGRVRLDDIDWEGPFGHVVARAALDVRDTERLLLRARVVRATNIRLAKLAPSLRGTAALWGARGSLSLRRPLATLEARGRFVLRNFAVDGIGSTWRRIEAHAALRRGEVVVRDLEATTTAGDELLVPHARVRLRPLALRGEAASSHLSWATIAALAGLPSGRGVVRGKLRWAVGARGLDLDGTLTTDGVQIGGLAIGSGKLVLIRPDNGPGTTRLRTEGLLEGVTVLPSSAIQWGPWGRLRHASLDISTDAFDPRALLGAGVLPAWLQVAMSAKARLTLDGRGRVGARAHFEAGGLQIGIRSEYDRLRFDNRAPFDVAYTPRDGLEIGLVDLRTGDGHTLAACGRLSPDMDVDAAVRFDFPLWFGGLERSLFSRLDGRIYTASTSNAALPPCARPGTASPGFLRVVGKARLPAVTGRIVLDAADATPCPMSDGADEARCRSPHRIAVVKLRDMSDTIEVSAPASIELAALGTQAFVAAIADAHPWTGRFGDGRFELSGTFRAVGGRVTQARARLTVSDVPYALSKELRVRTSGELRLGLRQGAPRQAPPLVLSGTLNVVEGIYAPPSRPRALLLFGATGNRRVEVRSSASSPSPALEALGLDLRIQSANVAVHATLPFAQTELTLQMDLQVRGTAASPKVFGHVEILPGGAIRRTVIGRDFDVERASVDFDGNPDRPHVAAEVSTELTFRRQVGSSLTGASRALSSLSGPVSEEETIRVTLSFDGEAHFDEPGHEFDDIEVQIASDAGYEPAELMTALLTGAPPGAAAGTDPGVTVSVLADNLARALASSLFGALVQEVSFDIGPQGFGWQLGTSLGRAFHLRLEGTQTAAGQTVRPRFEFRITDRLSLEGALRLQQFQEDAPSQTYEAKLRYRIPLR